MTIRKAKPEDFDTIMEIYAGAQERMIADGNPTQWAHIYPDPDLVREDIQIGRSYVVCEGDGACAVDKLRGVFVFIIGDDPTYRVIEGAWLNDEPYGVIHRIARAEDSHGILEEALAFAEETISNVRIDTHADNAIMQHLLSKYGYMPCGTIYVDDGSPRIAYHKAVQG